MKEQGGNSMLAVMQKELKSYFTSAIGYLFIGIFLLISGIFFSSYNLMQESGDYISTLSSITFIFWFIVPILTMRIMSEEMKNRTDQLLLTSPIDINSIVVGKFFAAVLVFLIGMVITFIYPLILKTHGTVSMSEIICAYIGFFFLGCSLIAIGVFISSLTENQIISAIATFGAMILLYILDSIQQSVPSTVKSGIIFTVILITLICLLIYYYMKNVFVSLLCELAGIIAVATLYFSYKSAFSGFISKFLGWFSLNERFQAFSAGILNINSIVYYISFVFVFLFLTVRVLEKRRWN